MRWIACLIVLLVAGCSHDKLTVKVETKPFTQDTTVSATYEVSR
jgi:hypothetical protein